MSENTIPFNSLPWGSRCRLPTTGDTVYVKRDWGLFVACIPPRSDGATFQLYTARQCASWQVVPTDDPVARASIGPQTYFD